MGAPALAASVRTGHRVHRAGEKFASRFATHQPFPHLGQTLRVRDAAQHPRQAAVSAPNRVAAELVPFRTHDAGKVRAAIDELKAFQETHDLRGLSVRQMIEEGRRY